MRIALACVVSVLLVACGDDGGSGGTDGGGGGDGGGGQDAAPVANCTPLDLASAPTVTLVTTDFTPNAQGGTLTAGTYELTSVKLDVAIQVTGTAQARIEVVTGSATSGAARIALNLNGMALGQPIVNMTTGAGLYTLAGSALNLTEGCGGTNPLSGLTYTASGTNLTVWTVYAVTDPIMIDVPIELVFALE